MPQLNVTIVSLVQEMQLSNGAMHNFVLLELPNGRQIRALVDDKGAEEIVQLAVEGRSDTIPSPPPDMDEPPAEEPGVEEPVVFGGTEGLPTDVPEPAQALPPPPTQAKSNGKPAASRRPKQRAGRVEKDEMGYPVMRIAGAVDPHEVTGSRDRDEDGVGQV